MAVTFRIPGPLRPLAGGQNTVRLESSAATVGDALEALWGLHPELRHRILTERGELRPHVNVFVGAENIRYTGGLATPLAGEAEGAIIPAVSGGVESGSQRLAVVGHGEMLAMLRVRPVSEVGCGG
jgi:molybdopterin converting factor small subunit